MNASVMKSFSILFLLVTAFESVSWATDPPNVIFIVADDMGYADLGTQGARGFKTTLGGSAVQDIDSSE